MCRTGENKTKIIVAALQEARNARMPRVRSRRTPEGA
jgi:hypothetical protein